MLTLYDGHNKLSHGCTTDIFASYLEILIVISPNNAATSVCIPEKILRSSEVVFVVPTDCTNLPQSVLEEKLAVALKNDLQISNLSTLSN